MHNTKAIWMLAPRSITLVPEELDTLAPDAVAVQTAYSAISQGTELLVYRGHVALACVVPDASRSARAE